MLMMLSRFRFCTAGIAWATLINAAFAGNSEFKVERGQTDGDVMVQAVDRDGVTVIRSDHDHLSDASFTTFAQWPELRGVYLGNSAVTGVGFRKLESHKKLVQVRLYGPNVNDDGVRAVSLLSGITHLGFGNGYDTTDCKYHVHHAIVTDRALKAVAGMPNLAYLSIDNAAITDEGIQQLGAMKSIRDISFFRCTGLTEEGILRLRAALPRARITASVPDLAEKK
jgi:hypothetical protein